MRTEIIPSYLYQQYYDDQDLQAFVSAYNSLSQEYLNWMDTLNLPIYTTKTGASLYWIARGIYGITRPALATPFQVSLLGVYDTVPYDTTAYSENITAFPISFYPVTDDYFKRIITWNFYKGDGFQYTTQWLKRRVFRFLFGLDGVSPFIDQTYSGGIPAVLTGCTISGTTLTVGAVTSGAIIPYMTLSGDGVTEPCYIVSGSELTWTISRSLTISSPTAMKGLNGVGVTYTAPNTIVITIPDLPIAPIFQAAIQAGVLAVPFQYTYTITY